MGTAQRMNDHRAARVLISSSRCRSSRDDAPTQTRPNPLRCLPRHFKKGQDKQMRSLARDQGTDFFSFFFLFFFFFEIFKYHDIIKLPEGFSKAIRSPGSDSPWVLLTIPRGGIRSFDIRTPLVPCAAPKRDFFNCSRVGLCHGKL